MNNLAEVEKLLGVVFKDKNLLNRALTHRSYLNENGHIGEHNERLEFLGDAVLELVVTEFLYKNFNNPEGDLTNWRSAVVRGEELCQFADKLTLGQFLQMSKGEEKSGGRSRGVLLANTFESVIGAIYLDQGYKVAADFIHKNVLPRLEEITTQGAYLDPKSKLQELAQEKLGITPSYKIIKEEGPDHAKAFTVGVYVGEKRLDTGEGSSKQRAETSAAIAALKNWQA